MCVNSKLVYTRALHADNLSAIRINTKCGNCIECNLSKVDGYLLRCSSELALLIRKRSGFVYFDTLTYNDKNLPRDLGFSHFRLSDVRTFVRTLKRYINETYPLSAKDRKKYFKLSYLITCEYGTTPGATHRPHYHCLFFVDHPLCSAAKFHELITKAWKKGHTDLSHNSDYTRGVVYSSCSIPGYIPRPVKNALMYVCKYVAKDNSLDEKIKTLSPEQIEVANLYEFKPRPIISINFGKCLLHELEQAQNLIDKGYFSFRQPGDKKPREIPIPAYYYRKLFYNVVKTIDKDGKQHVEWVPIADKLVEFKTKHLEKNISTRINVLKSLLSTDYANDIYAGTSQSYRTYIYQLLNGRTLKDYVIYTQFYRNRYNRDNIINVQNYTLQSVAPLIDKPRFDLQLYDCLDFQQRRKFISNYLINQNSAPEFEHFDDVYTLFSVLESKLKKQKALNAEKIYLEKKKLKSLYLHV